jgi:hypothetical protein
MERQGLPTGQIPVHDWPIRENAWANVARSVLADEIYEFIARIGLYLRTVLLKEERARLLQIYGREFGLLDYDMELMGGGPFIDPRHDLSRFPFRHLAWYWSPWRAAWWAAAGAVCLGSVGNAVAAWLGPNAASGFGLVARHVLPAALLAFAIAYLVLKETMRYANLRLRPREDGETPGGVFGFFLGILFREAGPNSHERRPILARTARLLARPLVVLAAVTATAVRLSAPGERFGHAAGAAVGLGCYLVSRYRVPAVVIRRRVAPTPHDVAVALHGLTWTLRSPRELFPEIERSRIGSAPSPRPRLIEGFSYESSISAWMVLRAIVDAGWITAVGVAAAVGLRRLGLDTVMAAWVALCLVSVVVHLVGYRPLVYRWGDESWPRAAWRAYRPLVLHRAIRTYNRLFFTLLAAAGISFLILKAGLKGFLWLSLGGVVAVLFGVRLLDQVVKANRANYPMPSPDPPTGPAGDPARSGGDP